MDSTRSIAYTVQEMLKKELKPRIITYGSASVPVRNKLVPDDNIHAFKLHDEDRLAYFFGVFKTRADYAFCGSYIPVGTLPETDSGLMKIAKFHQFDIFNRQVIHTSPDGNSIRMGTDNVSLSAYKSLCDKLNQTPHEAREFNLNVIGASECRSIAQSIVEAVGQIEKTQYDLFLDLSKAAQAAFGEGEFRKPL